MLPVALSLARQRVPVLVNARRASVILSLVVVSVHFWSVLSERANFTIVI